MFVSIQSCGILEFAKCLCKGLNEIVQQKHRYLECMVHPKMVPHTHFKKNGRLYQIFCVQEREMEIPVPHKRGIY